MTAPARPKIVIAGGGTGGHLFPGIALAEVLRASGCDVVFVGTARGIEARVCPRDGWPLELIDVGGLRGGGLYGTLRGLLRVPRSVCQSRAVLRRHRPSLVVGVGGYASGPVCLAAWLRRVPVVVLEQNSIPGFTNKVVGRLARRVFLTFEASRRFFPANRCVVTGNPIRQMFVTTNILASESESRPARPFFVFVFGGSQGARAINRAVVSALPHLRDLRADLFFVHQSGDAMLEEVRAAYEASGMRAEVYAFIDDMASMYRRAHVVVSRAGATTLAELTSCGKASLLIPFPYAVDNHQEHNARALSDAGAALLLLERNLTPESLAAALRALLTDPARISAMETAARTFARPGAAREIAKVCLEIAGAPTPTDQQGGTGGGSAPRREAA
jgi:UDP-N-acetylglucosamine--N-acetylmuramyl-(pentapeptide) pyrophosphoryl-undecaprenol N-acetylglucosamine transferase